MSENTTAVEEIEAQSEAPKAPKSVAKLEEEGDIAADYLEGLLDIADLDGDIDIDVENGRASLAIVGGKLRHLVGPEGEVLDAIQELTRLAVQTSTGDRSRLMLDIEGFRAGRLSMTARRAFCAASQRAAQPEDTMNGSVAPMQKPLLCIVTPALADANNGNWQTAQRWARLLSSHYRVHVARQWPDAHLPDADLLLALHARRSAPSVAAWSETGRGLVVVLTGTDLYRDIAHDASAQRSLGLAHRLVVLQEHAPLDLPPTLRPKCRVVFQSSPSRQTLSKTRAHLRAVMVGHLRDEKWPQTIFEAARLIGPHEGISITHIGRDLDPALGPGSR